MTSAEWADAGTGWRARVGSATHAGRRENNEDHVHVDPDYPFALVLDGMGGQAAGEVASLKGAAAVRAALGRGVESGAPPHRIIEDALREGNEAVLELGRSGAEFRGCGTTVVLALWHGGDVHVSWLGDSAAFLVSGGRASKLTWEHNLTRMLLRHGVITAEEAREHRTDNILLRFLGSEESREAVEVSAFTPTPGDRLVLATDGVTGVLSDADVARACLSHSDPGRCAEELVRLALERGSRDNCTCAVIAFEPARGAAPRPARRWWQIWR